MLSLLKIRKTLMIVFCAAFVASADVYNQLPQGFGQTGDFPKQQGLKFVDVTPEPIELLSSCYKEVGLNEKGEYELSLTSGKSFVSALVAFLMFVFTSRMTIELCEVEVFSVIESFLSLFNICDPCIILRPRLTNVCAFNIFFLFFLSIFIYILLLGLGFLDSKRNCDAELKRIFRKRLDAFVKKLFVQQQSGVCIRVKSGPVGALLNWILCVDISPEFRPKVFEQRLAEISNSCEFSNAIAAALKAKA